MGRIVTLGEVVADVYREKSPSDVELPFTARPGGAPANVAVAAAKLGAASAFVGRLGDDLFGVFILGALEAVGVDVAAVAHKPPPARTTLAFVELDDDGDRRFTFYRSTPAADDLLGPEDITPELLEGASFASFGSLSLIKDPMRSAARRFTDLARELSVPVAFDVNLRENLWSGLDEFRAAVEPILDRATIVKLSAEEVTPALGTDDVEAGISMLLDRGAALVLVSLGGEGAIYATAEFRGSVPAYDVDVIDATGAGDAFLAGVLTHLSENDGWRQEEETIRTALRRGSGAGALACTDYGAMRALPTRAELDRFLVERG